MTISQPRSEQREISVCLIAGEASGDAQGALLIHALRDELASAGSRMHAWGSGGKLMMAAGLETLVHIEELSAMGFAEVLSVYPRISDAAHRLQSALSLRRPQITILIDYPGLNMRLMEDAFHLGSCVVYHIPPKIWAHGAARAARLRDNTYLVTCILPFEENLLKRAGVNARFVGNPLNDEIVKFLKTSASERTALHGVTQVGIVPGSRSAEIERVFPTLIKSFVRTRKEYKGELKAIVPIANTVSRSRLETLLSSALAEENAQQMRVDIELKSDANLMSVLKDCKYAWVCSGTAALETALLEIPMSVVYKMHWMTYEIAKRIVSLPYISLVNLCANREIVPEFLQNDASPEKLSAHALSILNSEHEELAMKSALSSLKKAFPLDSARNAARAILDCYKQLPTDSARRFHFKAASDLLREDHEWGLTQ